MASPPPTPPLPPSTAMLTDDQFDRFARMIRTHCGIYLPVRKAQMLDTRIRSQMRDEGHHDVEAYYRLLSSPPGRRLRRRLIDSVTTNETSFFRTPSHFEWFASEFLPAVRHRDRAKPADTRQLRLWSAACSIGAEPYSLAMILQSQDRLMKDYKIDLLGSDLSHEAIDTAKRAEFKSRLVDRLPDGWLNRYFRELDASDRSSFEGTSSTFRLRDDIVRRVRFETHNLLNPPPMQRCDVIFLRNVLIYFDPPTRQRVLDNVVSALAPGGYLAVGPSEGIYGMEHPLEKISTLLYRHE